MTRPTLHLTSAHLLADPCPVCRKGRRVSGRNGDLAGIVCPAALDLVMGRLDPEDADAAHKHYHAAAYERPAVLAAMAWAPPWVQPYTMGKPAWSYAVGSIRPLLTDALRERQAGERGPALAAYRAAMDARWARCVDEGRFALGAWVWRGHIPGEAPGLVPDGATLVCTCRPGQECHLQWFAPHLERAGYAVELYGGTVPAALAARRDATTHPATRALVAAFGATVQTVEPDEAG